MYSHINWSDIRAMVTYPVAEHHYCLTSPKAVNNLVEWLRVEPWTWLPWLEQCF